MKDFIYKGSKTNEISFPLGGIGSGCIGLSGNGRLIDWEIFNRPNKGSINGFSHFAIKAENEEKVLSTKILNGDLHAPYGGDFNRPLFTSFGFGPHRSTLAGVPHFKNVEFKGEYPFAQLKFIDDKFPGNVNMNAFNPLIPLNDKDSSIPSAFFEIEVENTTDEVLTYTIAMSLSNPFPSKYSMNSYEKVDGMSVIKLEQDNFGSEHPEYGNLCVGTDAADVSYQEYWFRTRWFDNVTTYWNDLNSKGKLKNRNYPAKLVTAGNQAYGAEDVGTLAAHIKLEPNTKEKVKFVISWSYPNCHNYWNAEPCGCSDSSCCSETSEVKTWKNYYASLFSSSKESALYSLKNWNRLYKETLLFKEALFTSSLPIEAIDAISANISILKTPTCLRLEDGSFYGFEGCHCQEGCCEGSCTHVWNYAYALPFLFPKLERSMRDLDFKYNQRDDGGMVFRLMLPLGRSQADFRPCVDGQFGGVIKAYRDWKISGDTEWLRGNWEAIKKSIDFAWAESNEDKWDYDKDGVVEGRQHHTLDMELFGPSSWLTGFYLAALKCGSEIAEFFGETEVAKEYMDLFDKGKKFCEESLFNGEYYTQKVDLNDKSLLEKYDGGVSLYGDSTVDAYWNEEKNELKYQVGDGCVIDQVLAQWHANICGFGEIFDRENTKSALKAIYKNNFKKSMRDFFNPCRLYSLNDEGGLIICDYPEGTYVPGVPLPYAEETMNGFEYQAAIHMIQEGLVEEGMEIIKAVRDRYDGERRNPWNEFECGSNYARSMASYAILNAYSGFEFDMVKNMVGFAPIVDGDFKCFWSLDSGWGTFEIKDNKAIIKLLYGELQLYSLKLKKFADKISDVKLNNKDVGFEICEDYIKFDYNITIKAEQELELYL